MSINKNIQDLLEKRYFLRDENDNLLEKSWEDIVNRVSNNISQAEKKEDVEKWREIFKEKILNMEFIPSSPCLFNAGTKSQQLSSCFVVDIDDNIESIFNTVAECAKIFQRCGGAGFSIGKLRPRGDICRASSGKASGVISFMKIFNEVVEEIKQSGKRKGALKVDLPVNHPEIFDFIHCKDDTTKLNNMNISVSLTNEFLDAVENDLDWDLSFKGKVYRTVKAKEVWNEIITSAWKTGEPGISYQDNMDNGNMNPHLSENVYGNPCVSGDTLILTKEGYLPIQDTVGKIISVWNGFEFSEVQPKITGHNQNMLNVTLSDGTELSCTLYHKFVLNNGTEVEAKDLKEGDKLLKYTFPIIEGDSNIDTKKAYTMGFYSGDGTKNNKRMHVYKDKQSLLEYFDCEYFYTQENSDISVVVLKEQFEKNYVPNASWNINSRLNWLAGLLDSDGCNIDLEGGLSISSINKDFLMKVKFMINTLGCNSCCSLYKDGGEQLLPDGKGGEKTYTVQNGWRLTISPFNTKKLMDLGLKTYRVRLFSNPNRDASRFIQVKSIVAKPDMEKTVYCFNEPIRHLGCFNGVVTGQCHEFVNIPYSSCNLASVNLVKCIVDGKLDYDKLKTNIEITFRFLDDMITMNRLPLEKIEKITKLVRPIGLGTMGLADLLYSLQIPYNSEKAIKFLNELYRFIQKTCIDYNTKLSKEKGCYEAWEDSKWEEMGTEVRCSSMLSIAPNGSIAFIAGTTGGIEPEFALVYSRQTNEGTIYFVVNKIFEQYLKDVGLYSEELLDKIAKNGGSIKGMNDIFGKKIQDVFVTASDISPDWHVKVLSTIQKYVDLSISKTVNVPNNANIKDVGDIYMKAGRLGIKGLTVYRDGSRDSQVLFTGTTNNTTKTEEPKINVYDSVKPISRKKIGKLTGTTDYKKVACGDLYITVNKDKDGCIAETFVNTSKNGICKSNIDGLNRMISLCLRSGVMVNEIVDQLSGIKCPSCTRAKLKGEEISGQSCADCLSQCLKDEYQHSKVAIKTDTVDSIKDNSTKEEAFLCPDCGTKMRLIEGCQTCVCGYSKCS